MEESLSDLPMKRLVPGPRDAGKRKAREPEALFTPDLSERAPSPNEKCLAGNARRSRVAAPRPADWRSHSSL
jgi:hypothetical protein